MRQGLLIVVGLWLGGCATLNAPMRALDLSPTVASSPPNESMDVPTCERSFEADNMCPVLGMLNGSEQQDMASFVQESHAQQVDAMPPSTMMQATDGD